MTNAHAPLAGLKVLIAEDTWHTAIIIQQNLEAAGATVVGVAGNLEDAETMSARSSCDAIVMDLNMNGERADQLAAKLADSGLTVVVLSAYRRPEGLSPNICAFLSKPAEPEKLITALTSAPCMNSRPR